MTYTYIPKQMTNNRRVYAFNHVNASGSEKGQIFVSWYKVSETEKIKVFK